MFGLCITLYISKTASAQMSQTVVRPYILQRKVSSNTLANSLTERERNELLSQSPFFAEADFHNPRVQQQLEQVKVL